MKEGLKRERRGKERQREREKRVKGLETGDRDTVLCSPVKVTMSHTVMVFIPVCLLLYMRRNVCIHTGALAWVMAARTAPLNIRPCEPNHKYSYVQMFNSHTSDCLWYVCLAITGAW